MSIRDAIPSLFSTFLSIVALVSVTLKWKTNLHCIDLLIMQNASEVR